MQYVFEIVALLHLSLPACKVWTPAASGRFQGRQSAHEAHAKRPDIMTLHLQGDRSEAVYAAAHLVRPEGERRL